MTIKELVSMAKYGELRNLGLGDSPEEAIVSYINLGLIELYKRFRLSTKECIIALNDATDEYELPEDCMWLISAYGEVPDTLAVGTYELSINNEDDPLSVNTVGWNKIQVPVTVNGSYISLIYAAAATTINYTKEGFTENSIVIPADSYWSYKYNKVTSLIEPTVVTQLELPPQLIECLLHYVGYRAHGSMDGSIQAENNTHYMRFDASCKRIEQNGMFTNDNLDMNTRISDKGFV